MGTPKYKAIPHLSKERIAIFKSRIGPINERGCREWIGYRHPKGYGMFQVGNESVRVHRIAFFLHTGLSPQGMSVKHSCDNPSCVEGEHLSLGTHASNMADMADRGRAARGEKSGLAKLTGLQVLSIRERYQNRECSRDEFAEQYGITKNHVYGILSRRNWKHI